MHLHHIRKSGLTFDKLFTVVDRRSVKRYIQTGLAEKEGDEMHEFFIELYEQFKEEVGKDYPELVI